MDGRHLQSSPNLSGFRLFQFVSHGHISDPIAITMRKRFLQNFLPYRAIYVPLSPAIASLLSTHFHSIAVLFLSLAVIPLPVAPIYAQEAKKPNIVLVFGGRFGCERSRVLRSRGAFDAAS